MLVALNFGAQCSPLANQTQDQALDESTTAVIEISSTGSPLFEGATEELPHTTDELPESPVELAERLQDRLVALGLLPPNATYPRIGLSSRDGSWFEGTLDDKYIADDKFPQLPVDEDDGLQDRSLSVRPVRPNLTQALETALEPLQHEVIPERNMALLTRTLQILPTSRNVPPNPFTVIKNVVINN